MNSNKLSNLLNRIFNIVFIILFGIIFIGIIITGYENNGLGYSWAQRLCVVIFSVVFLAVLSFAYIYYNKLSDNRIKKKHTVSNKQINIFIFISLAIMLALQITVGYCLRMNPINDMEIVDRYARNLGETGNFDFIKNDFENGKIYLLRYQNNFAIVLLLGALYRVSVLLFGNILPILPIILNAVAINLSVLFTVLTAKKLFGNRKSLFVLLLCFLFLPFYTYVPFYYTDSLSMPFCIGAIYVFVSAIKSNYKLKKYIYLIISGGLVFLGFKLKGSLIILLAVLLIYSFLKFNFKSVFCVFLAILAGFGTTAAIYTSSFNSLNIITEEQSDRYKFPNEHWIMMGLNGLGHFHRKDSDYTAQFYSYEEKKKADTEEIFNRIDNLGFWGLTNHIFNKAVWTWEDGTYYISHHIKDAQEENVLHSFVLKNGENYFYFFVYSNAFQLLLIFLILMSLLKGCINSKIDAMTLLRGVVFAAFVFFIIWETRSRYLYNFTPVFILTAFDGLDFITKRFVCDKTNNSLKKKRNNKHK